MDKITYEELLEEVEQEKNINICDVEEVIGQIMRVGGENGDFDDMDSPRKKLKKVVGLFRNSDFRIYGTPDNIHNCAVPYAKENMYEYACMILQRGLEESAASIDLLADYIRYGISCGKHTECEKYYRQLNEIPKEQWNWRAFSFSIDFLLDKRNRTLNEIERNELSRMAVDLSNEFVDAIGTDQAYFDKAQVLKVCGGYFSETEESILQKGLDTLKATPRCALRMAEILFERGEYKEAATHLKRCCINAFAPQPDVNRSYSFLLSALSKASNLFIEQTDNNYVNKENDIMEIYKDFNTAIEGGLTEIYRETANATIKILEAHTGFEYPYNNVEDVYDF